MPPYYTTKEGVQEAIVTANGKTEIAMLETVDNIDLQFAAKRKAASLNLLFMWASPAQTTPEIPKLAKYVFYEKDKE